MIFCPICANCLLIERGAKSNYQFFCKTCDYTFPVMKKVSNVIKLQTKQVDDVLGGKEAWKNVDQTDGIFLIISLNKLLAVCPKCNFNRAYHKMIQIRSADEPMTIFFKCANLDCEHQWREG